MTSCHSRPEMGGVSLPHRLIHSEQIDIQPLLLPSALKLTSNSYIYSKSNKSGASCLGLALPLRADRVLIHALRYKHADVESAKQTL